MNEQQWLTSTKPREMMSYLQDRKVSDRKCTLYCLACSYAHSPELGKDADRYVEIGTHMTSIPVNWAMAWSGDQPKPTEEERANLIREIFGNPFRPVRRAVYDNPCCPNRAIRHPGLACTCPPWLTSTVLGLATVAYRDRDWSVLGPLADALEEAGCDNEELLRHLRGEEVSVGACEMCHGTRSILVIDLEKHEENERRGRYVMVPPRKRKRCSVCNGTGQVITWRPLRSPHVRGCWALDLILGYS